MADASIVKKTIDQVMESHPESVRKTLRADLSDVARWLKCKPQNLELREENLPAEIFRELVNDLIESYDDFPAEKMRMQKILKEIEKGAPPLPVFIEEGDSENFIMEGRHRIVAFLMAGLHTVPVLFASKLKPGVDLDELAP